MQRLYDILPVNAEIKDVIGWADQVTRERNIDLQDYDNQTSTNPVIFEVPSSSSDVNGTEKVGDIAVGTDGGIEYLYVFVDNSGTLEWQRVALSTF